LARKDAWVGLGGPNNFFQRPGLDRLGHADGEIARLNDRQRPFRKVGTMPKKRKNSQNERGDGNLRARRKAGEPAFILLTREIHSGLKWVEVD